MEITKRQHSITLPEIILMAGSRMMMGAGLALLLGDRLTREQRKATGWSLFASGAFMRFPLIFQMFSKRELAREQTSEKVAREAA